MVRSDAGDTMKWLFLLCLVVAVLASAEDIWRRRVSNAVTAGAFVAGVGLRSWLFGLDGLWDALLGAVIGFVVFLVFYWLGGMGGGDIKLMSAFGTIVGGKQIFLAAVLTGIIGAMMAVAFLAVRKLRRLASSDPVSATPDRKMMIPYAPAISLGMLLTFAQFLD